MSAIGFDSCFYDRLDQFSKSLNHVLLATKRNASLAAEADWTTTLEVPQRTAGHHGKMGCRSAGA